MDRIREKEEESLPDLPLLLNLDNPVNPVYSFSSVVFLDTLNPDGHFGPRWKFKLIKPTHIVAFN
jgi:hypothetical protein